ncbi:calcium-binding protein [Falsiroseomonas selenitidurans]|uniref:Calcium-binding protein n=1 Tax=Falsiroseomonas selenitidurans TaxID=2716335 RepID=A0ABX1E252_9PROT|nr:calcium-binding protein [Falsiroseomonas selenitidurans]NKC29587.1 calcium-binding protein [Falsiroseomonas selenitidurans]
MGSGATEGAKALEDQELREVTGGLIGYPVVITPPGYEPPVNLNDTIVALDGYQLVNSGDGNDAIMTGSGDDIIDAGSGADTVMAGAGNDTMIGGTDADLMSGERGSDVFLWSVGDGADTIVGGQGGDTLVLKLPSHISLEDLQAGLSLESGGTAVIEDDRIRVSGAGTLTVEGTTLTIVDLEYIEISRFSVEGLAGNDVRYGHDRAQMITGEGGDDTIEAGGGNDTVSGGVGADTAIWSPGDGNDVFYGGEGQDTLLLKLPVSYPLEQVLAGIVMAEGAPPPTIEGDRIVLQGYGTLTIGNETIQFVGVESIRLSPVTAGTADDDLILGRSIAEAISGDAGDDTLIGGGGADRIDAGAGADLIIWSAGDGSDTIDGGAGLGIDTLRLEDTGLLTPADLIAAMTLPPGQVAPVIMADGRLQVAGITGSITVQGQTIHFTNLEYIELGGYMYFEGRGG